MLPKSPLRKNTELLNRFDEDKDIIAVLSSGMSQDYYELYLYPKAKNKSVEEVIKNYKKIFKSMGQ